MRYILSVLGIFCLTGSLFSQEKPGKINTYAKPITIDENFTKMAIGKNLEYIEDKEKKVTIDEITANKNLNWEQSKTNSIGFGFTKSAYWFRFLVENKTKNDITIYAELDYPLLDYIDFYIMEEPGKSRVIKTGDETVFSTRDVEDRNFVFMLKVRPGLHTYYYRLYCPSSSMGYSISLWSHRSFISRSNREFPIIWIYYGLMMIMVVYNLFIFIAVREKSYAYYVLCIFMWIMVHFTLNGFSYQYLWPNSPKWATQCILFMITSMTFFISSFIQSYMETKKYFPVIHRFMIITILIPSLIGFIAAIFLPYPKIIKPINAHIFYSTICYIFVGIYGVISGSRPAKYITSALLVVFVGILLWMLKTFGVIPYTFLTHWALQIGSAAMVVLFSLGLADKINTMKNELANLNVNLEKKVEHRTEELNAANEELEAMNSSLTEARDALWGEMQLAKKIQTVLLPENPCIRHYDIYAYMKPTDEVGGDYYDIINAEGKDWIVIGDVSGHGIPAGLIMMMVQTAIHSTINQNPDLSPAELLVLINKTIMDNIKKLHEDKYMTLTVLAVYDKGEFIFSGLHLDIMVYRSKSQTVELIETNGIWIGIMDDVSTVMRNDTLTTNKDDVILLYTDGIIEAWGKNTKQNERAATEMFGSERLRNILQKFGNTEFSNIKNEIFKELKKYEIRDDITMVLIKKVD